MIKLCNFKEKPDIILFNEEDFTVEELGMEVDSELHLNSNMEFDNQLANQYPIAYYSDFIYRTKGKTVTDKLSRLGIENLADLCCENTLIELKKSNLSHSERETVQYNRLAALI